MTKSAGKGNASSIILFNKPFDVLCQFSDGSSTGNKTDSASPRHTLANYINSPGFYPAGRLDRDSEGLLVLTNDGKLQSRISHPRFKMAKTYFAQVEGEISQDALQQLRDGVILKDGLTRRALAESIDEPAFLWQRDPPIRQRKTFPPVGYP